MKKTMSLDRLILMIALAGGCAQQNIPQKTATPVKQPESTISMDFMFANEAQFDITLSARIGGESVYEKKLISYTTAGGYFGQEVDYKTLKVPNQSFTLKVTESTTGLEESTLINPVDGKYVGVTFWTDNYMIIQQTKEKQVRTD